MISQVYAQQTQQNERFCSLLSATLLRNILSQFSSAVLEKASHRNDLPDCSENDVPVILFIHQKDEERERNCECFSPILRQITKEHGIRLVDVSLDDFPINDISYACTKYKTQPLVILSCSSSVGSVYQYIARCMEHRNPQQLKLGSLLAVISIEPTACTPILPLMPVPVLIIASSGPSSNTHRRRALVDPSVIVVTNEEIGQTNLSDFSEATALWVARTVAKGSNAMHALSKGRIDDLQVIVSRL